MEELTTQEVAAIFAAAGDSVTVINGGKPEWETDAEWKLTVERNVKHLEMKPPLSGLLRILQILIKQLLMVKRSTEAKWH